MTLSWARLFTAEDVGDIGLIRPEQVMVLFAHGISEKLACVLLFPVAKLSQRKAIGFRGSFRAA